MKAEMCTNSQTKLIKKVYREKYRNIYYSHDVMKFNKIMKHIKRYGTATKKQYRAFKHICRVNKIKLDNSITFILD